MDELMRIAGRQAGRLSRQQLLDHGGDRNWIHRKEREGWLHLVHTGVYGVGPQRTDQEAKWWGAVLTHPGTALFRASAGAIHGFRPHRGSVETVVRPGSGGPERLRGLVIHRALLRDGDVTRVRGIPVTSGARTLLDLFPKLNDRERSKLVREALRLKATDRAQLWLTIDRHHGARGVRTLRLLAERYAALPIERTRSDAEAFGLEVLAAAGLPTPRVNEEWELEEADLCWPEQRLIVEIDGPQFHLFEDEDERKRAIWEAAGWTVRRISSDDVFETPGRLVALVRSGFARERRIELEW